MHQPHKMVKYTQTIHLLLTTNCLSVFDNLVGLALKGLKNDQQKPFRGEFRQLWKIATMR